MITSSIELDYMKGIESLNHFSCAIHLFNDLIDILAIKFGVALSLIVLGAFPFWFGQCAVPSAG